MRSKSSIFASLVRSGNIWIWVAILLVFALVFNQQGLYAIVFADEQVYSKHSRLIDISSAPMPSYLYLKFFRITNYCGDGFLACARLMNVGFLVASMLVIYSISRLRLDRTVSLVLSLLPLVYPTNSYATYFMPEVAYAFVIYATIYLTLRQDTHGFPRGALMVGAFVGLAALIKVHGLFLLPGFIAFYLFRDIRSLKDRPGEVIKEVISLCAAAVIVRMSLGYALAGSAGFSLLGYSYSKVADSSSQSLADIWQWGPLIVKSLSGHVLILAILFPIPLLVLGRQLYGWIDNAIKPASPNSRVDSDEDHLPIILFFLIAVMMLVTVVFSAAVASSGGYESIGRLHLRYYNFLVPLLLIVTTNGLKKPSEASSHFSGIAILLVYSGLGLLALSVIAGFNPTNFVDSPEFQSIRGWNGILASLVVIGLASLALWTYNTHWGIKAYLIVFLPLFLIQANFQTFKQQRNSQIPDIFVKAAVASKAVLDRDRLERLTVVGSSLAGVLEAAFYLDVGSVNIDVTQPDGTYASSKLLPGKVWVLFVGDYPKPESGFEVLFAGDQFELMHLVEPSKPDS